MGERTTPVAGPQVRVGDPRRDPRPGPI